MDKDERMKDLYYKLLLVNNAMKRCARRKQEILEEMAQLEAEGIALYSGYWNDKKYWNGGAKK